MKDNKIGFVEGIIIEIRKVYRSYFWKKNWYKKWVLNRFHFFIGKGVLLKGGGWVESNDMWK